MTPKNSTSILLLQGWVMNIGNGQTLIQCPTSGRFDVKWKNGHFPSIKTGQYISIIGQLITLNLGKSFIVVRAELLKPKALQRIKKLMKEEVDGREKGSATGNQH